MAKDTSDQVTGKVPVEWVAKLNAKLAATGTSRSAFVRECVERYIAEPAAEPTADPAAALLDAIKNELAVVAVFILSAQQKRLVATADAIAAVRAAYLSGALAGEVLGGPPAAGVPGGGAS